MIIIFDIDCIYNKVILLCKENDRKYDAEYYYNIDLLDCNKQYMIKFINFIYANQTIIDNFRYKISPNNLYKYGPYVYNLNVYLYLTPYKFQNATRYHYDANLPKQEDIHLDFFIEKWKEHKIQLDIVAEIEKRYNNYLIQSIIE